MELFPHVHTILQTMQQKYEYINTLYVRSKRLEVEVE